MPIEARIRFQLKRMGAALLDMLLPGRCLHCHKIIPNAGALCDTCWPQMPFITEPVCAACGYPFEYDLGPGTLCLSCLAVRPPFNQARAFLRYDDFSSRPILAFKHGDRTDIAKPFASWLANHARQLINRADVLVPVPLHWTRLWHRRYNQAALLAIEIARMVGKPYLADTLQRHKRTESQGRKSRSERERNVRGAFTLHPRRRARVEGKSVLLVDDVMTTGATIDACSRLLLKGGARQVDVLTLARVVRPGQMP